MGRKIKGVYRSFPHTNAARKDFAKYDADIEEMREEGISTDKMPGLRHGKSAPDTWDDVIRQDARKSWKTKPKGTRHRNRETIRTLTEGEPVDETGGGEKCDGHNNHGDQPEI